MATVVQRWLAGRPRMAGLSLADRFRGSLVGALVGDCLGANFECQHENLVPRQLLDTFFRDLEEEKNNQRYV